MSRPCRSTAATFLVTGIAALAFQASPAANHSWNGYHWGRTANPFTVDLGDNLTSNWKDFLNIASSDWSQSTVLNTVVVTGRAKPRNCRPTSGHVEVCNASYGSTGWLGVAQVWVSGSHITQATVKVNDTYFSTSTYNKPELRQMVMCQEVGHTFGLDHQDTNFNNGNLGTCMDYTNDPLGPPSNTDPNKHDYDELVAIYSHLDSSTTVGAIARTGAPSALDHSSDWGQLMKVSHGGKTQVFERDFGNGQRVVTFVIWA